MYFLKFKGPIEFESNLDEMTIESLKELHFTQTTKLMYKGKQLQNSHSLSEVFTISTNKPYILMYSMQLQSTIDHHSEKVAIKEQGTINYQKALLSRPKHTIIKAGYFKKLEPLSAFADIQSARALLQKLRDDSGIIQIMKEREWRVSLLLELHPNQKTILGYNQNKGQIIALRLRTDLLDGFRAYREIIRVLLHELAHMIFSEHDSHFHNLNRELNRDYDRYTHGNVISSTRINSNNISVDRGGSFRLGGSNAQGDMRQILGDAAEKRLTKEEQEVENGCKL